MKPLCKRDKNLHTQFEMCSKCIEQRATKIGVNLRHMFALSALLLHMNEYGLHVFVSTWLRAMLLSLESSVESCLSLPSWRSCCQVNTPGCSMVWAGSPPYSTTARRLGREARILNTWTGRWNCDWRGGAPWPAGHGRPPPQYWPCCPELCTRRRLLCLSGKSQWQIPRRGWLPGCWSGGRREE